MTLTEFIQRTGVTYRQANYWAMNGLYEADAATGSGRPRAYTAEDARRAIIARDISGLGLTGLVDLVLAIVRLADLVDAPFVAITPDRNLHALHDVAEAGDEPGSAVLVVNARPDIDAHLAAAS